MFSYAKRNYLNLSTANVNNCTVSRFVSKTVPLPCFDGLRNWFQICESKVPNPKVVSIRFWQIERVLEFIFCFVLHIVPWYVVYNVVLSDNSSLLCNLQQTATILNELACEYICARWLKKVKADIALHGTPITELVVWPISHWLVVGKKASTKAPKIQRLVTPLVLQRKRHRLAQKRRRATKKREEAAEYQKLLAQRLKEAKERKLERRRTASHSKSSMTRTDSTSSAGKKWTNRAEYRTTDPQLSCHCMLVINDVRNFCNKAVLKICLMKLHVINTT